jgi:hypothetical protein
MSVQVFIPIDETTKQQFDDVCEVIGIAPSHALSMFIQNVINDNGIPSPSPAKLSFGCGCMKGTTWMTKDFDAPLEEMREQIEPVKKRPKLGGWEGKIWMADDFDAPMEEFAEYM